MKRIDMRLASLLLAAFVVASTLGVGCKEGGQKPENSTEGSPSALGGAALDEGNWSRAVDKFTEALEANASDVDAYYGRAVASTAIAKEHYQLAQAAATNQDVKAGQAEASKADEFFKNAVDDCDKAIELDPKYSDAYFLKGVVAQYQGAWEQGIEAFSECVKLDPENAEAYHRRGEIYDNIGDYMNSSVDFKKASELGFSDGTEEATASDDFSDLNYTPEGTDDESSDENAEENGAETAPETDSAE